MTGNTVVVLVAVSSVEVRNLTKIFHGIAMHFVVSGRAIVLNFKPKKDIEIQGLQWESMQDLLKLKVEMKQYQNINLTMGNLPSFPMVNMHMANDLTNEIKQKEFERRIFENINSILLLEDGFLKIATNPFGSPRSYDLLFLFSCFYLYQFQQSNIPNSFLLKNRLGLSFVS